MMPVLYSKQKHQKWKDWMTKKLEPIQFEKIQPLYQQLVTAIEEQIYSGKLLPGDKLPTTLDLSKQFNLAKNTIQQALTILVQRGLLERTTGRGTFVTKQVKSKTIALVSGINYLFRDDTRFYQVICAELQKQLKEAGWLTKLYIPVDANDSDKMLFELGLDMLAGNIRGCYLFCGTDDIYHWLDKNCKIPYFTNFQKEATKFDVKQEELYRGLAYLMEKSFQKIAIIGDNDQFDFVAHCISRAKTDFNPEAAIEYFFSKDINESNGYHLVKEKVLRKIKDFDAMLVTNDIMCKGVIFGLMEAGIKIPDDLAVVTHSNKGIPILSPVSLTRIEVDTHQYAATILHNLFAKIYGGEIMPVEASRLIVGKSCGE